MAKYATGVTPAKGVWWQPAHRSEKIWFTIAFVWCMVLFAMMPFWHLLGGQNPSGIRSKVDPEAFRERVDQFIADYQIGEDNGLPLVAPPPGSDIYMLGQMWLWTPVLQLEQGAEYTLHLSSTDVNHGFNLYPFNVNFQVVPGYDYGLRVTPTEAGDFRVVCNEFCGVGHHVMVGKIVVTPTANAGEQGSDPGDQGGDPGDQGGDSGDEGGDPGDQGGDR